MNNTTQESSDGANPDDTNIIASYIVKLKVEGSKKLGKNITLEWILPDPGEVDGYITTENKIELNYETIPFSAELLDEEKVKKLKDDLRGLVGLEISKDNASEGEGDD